MGLRRAEVSGYKINHRENIRQVVPHRETPFEPSGLPRRATKDDSGTWNARDQYLADTKLRSKPCCYLYKSNTKSQLNSLLERFYAETNMWNMA